MVMVYLFKIISLIFILAVISCPGEAQEKQILPITPPPTFTLPPYADEYFSYSNIHGMGMINRIDGNEMVIDDTLYQVGNRTRYINEQGEFCSGKIFQVGFEVKYQKNPHQKDYIDKVWLINR